MPGQPARDSNPFLWFDVTGLTVVELGPPPVLPETTVIQANQACQVRGSFEFGGWFADWLVSLPVKWKFSVKAESMGPEPELLLGEMIGTTNAGQLGYGPGLAAPHPAVTVPAGTLPPGVYKLVGTVAFQGTPPPPMAGYFEGPILQVF